MCVLINMQKILQMGQQMQSQMSEIQDELVRQEISATAGGGMVTATVDGRGQLKRLAIEPAAVDPADVEMLEELVLAAVHEAQVRARAVSEAEMQKLVGGLGLPFPIRVPGLF